MFHKLFEDESAQLSIEMLLMMGALAGFILLLVFNMQSTSESFSEEFEDSTSSILDRVRSIKPE